MEEVPNKLGEVPLKEHLHKIWNKFVQRFGEMEKGKKVHANDDNDGHKSHTH